MGEEPLPCFSGKSLNWPPSRLVDGRALAYALLLRLCTPFPLRRSVLGSALRPCRRPPRRSVVFPNVDYGGSVHLDAPGLVSTTPTVSSDLVPFRSSSRRR